MLAYDKRLDDIDQNIEQRVTGDTFETIIKELRE